MLKRKSKSQLEGENKIHKVRFSQKIFYSLIIVGLTFIGSMIDGAMLKYYRFHIISRFIIWNRIIIICNN
jgi:hypothetical protein